MVIPEEAAAEMELFFRRCDGEKGKEGEGEKPLNGDWEKGGGRRGRRFVGSVGCVKGGNSPEPPPSHPIAPCQEIKLRPREHVWEMAFWCQEGRGGGGATFHTKR